MRIFSSDFFLVAKYLLLDFVQGHSGQIRYNLFSIPQGFSLYLLSLSNPLTLWRGDNPAKNQAGRAFDSLVVKKDRLDYSYRGPIKK